MYFCWDVGLKSPCLWWLKSSRSNGEKERYGSPQVSSGWVRICFKYTFALFVVDNWQTIVSMVAKISRVWYRGNYYPYRRLSKWIFQFIVATFNVVFSLMSTGDGGIGLHGIHKRKHKKHKKHKKKHHRDDVHSFSEALESDSTMIVRPPSQLRLKIKLGGQTLSTKRWATMACFSLGLSLTLLSLVAACYVAVLAVSWSTSCRIQFLEGGKLLGRVGNLDNFVCGW